MKRFLAIPMIVVLGLSSCSVIQSARDKLTKMDPVTYTSLTIKVQNAGKRGGEKLQELLSSDAKDAAKILTDTLITAVETDSLDAQDLVKDIVDRYGDQLGLKPAHQEYIRDGAKLIDAAVGQIRLDIDGKLSEREKGLVLALLKGLKQGL